MRVSLFFYPRRGLSALFYHEVHEGHEEKSGPPIAQINKKL